MRKVCVLSMIMLAVPAFLTLSPGRASCQDIVGEQAADCCPCGTLGVRRCRVFHGCRRCRGCCGHELAGRYAEASSFNCGCNGSYKHPVPPLFTYHWPGMYSHQLMTDYHSPWRFPAVTPYEGESEVPQAPQVDELGVKAPVPGDLQPVTAVQAPPPLIRHDGEMEPLSEKLRKLYQ